MNIPLPNYKDIVDLLKKGATLEAQEKIMALREGALELQEDNLRLRKRVLELEQQIGANAGMEFKKPFYFRPNDEQPHCPVCWEKDRTTIHLNGPSGSGEWYVCSVCRWKHAMKPERDCGIAVVPRSRDRSILI